MSDVVQEDRSKRWRTAGVLAAPTARQFLGRLSTHGIDWITSIEGHETRISVRQSDLDQALELRPRLISRRRSKVAEWRYGVCLRMLFSIPVGGCLGTYVCLLFGFQSPTASTLAGIAFALLAEIFALRLAIQRQQDGLEW